MRTTIALLTSLGLSAGCSTNSVFPESPSWPWNNGFSCATATCTSSDALKAFTQASEFCRGVHNFYENTGNRSSLSSVALPWIGAIAGGVASPIAGGSAKTAWSGLSAATNAAQAGVEKNFSAAITSKKLSSVARAIDTGTERYLTASKDEPYTKIEISIAMAGSCSKAASQAENEALKAVIQSTSQ